jgi:hypothetical protein
VCVCVCVLGIRLYLTTTYPLMHLSQRQLQLIPDRSPVALPPWPARAMFQLEPPSWVDGDVCALCARGFTTMSRRHHCRACGRPCCSDCSPLPLALPLLGLPAPQRVCVPCADMAPLLATAAGVAVHSGKVVSPTAYAALQAAGRAAAELAGRVAELRSREDAALFTAQGGVRVLLRLALSPLTDLQVGQVGWRSGWGRGRS